MPSRTSGELHILPLLVPVTVYMMAMVWNFPIPFAAVAVAILLFNGFFGGLLVKMQHCAIKKTKQRIAELAVVEEAQ